MGDWLTLVSLALPFQSRQNRHTAEPYCYTARLQRGNNPSAQTIMSVPQSVIKGFEGG